MIENPSHTVGIYLMVPRFSAPDESEIDQAAEDLEYDFYSKLGYRSLQAQDEVIDQVGDHLEALLRAAALKDSSVLDTTILKLVTMACDAITRNRSPEWWEKRRADMRVE